MQVWWAARLRHTALRCWRECCRAVAAGAHRLLLLTCARTASRKLPCTWPARSLYASAALSVCAASR
jgi:hypothetical protein